MNVTAGAQVGAALLKLLSATGSLRVWFAVVGLLLVWSFNLDTQSFLDVAPPAIESFATSQDAEAAVGIISSQTLGVETARVTAQGWVLVSKILATMVIVSLLMYTELHRPITSPVKRDELISPPPTAE